MRSHIQGRLLTWCAIFLAIQSITLSLSLAVRERSWDVNYKLSHWIGLLIWGLLMAAAHRHSIKHLPECDPYLLPAAGLLSGWGLLTIWRLDESFGLRQALWLTVSIIVLITAMRPLKYPSFLRRYKYIFLVCGLIVTALTLILGTNPLGFGARLWLGCCGVYFQPSEPLKLLLIIYLSAYLADHGSLRLFSFPLLVPTIAVTGLALLLLMVQRDLGTASIFIIIFTLIIYLATGKKRVLLGAVLLLLLSLMLGSFMIDVIHTRVTAWINPWNDPSGSSYQIVQSLLAVANGGTIGRGLGIGSPSIVPVAISDFIYSAIAEESGLIGTVGLLALIWLILARGLLISINAADRFRRYLAGGVVIYFGIQSLLIIGGNIRLLPLTGVTLPFVSYGGSSLLTSFIGLSILLAISNLEDDEPAPLFNSAPHSILAAIFGLGLAACALTTGWWAIVRGPDLLIRTDNPRRAIADRFVARGNLLDRNNQSITITDGVSGSFVRKYLYPDLAPVTGYTHPVFGQAGLEAVLDDYLRGLKGNPTSLINKDEILYGTPPTGLNVRLSIDLTLQRMADQALGSHSGSILLMNADNGEILVMASHPTYNPNKLDLEGNQLLGDPSSPLLNRATQGLYSIGEAILPLTKAKFGSHKPTTTQLDLFYGTLGFHQAPLIDLPAAFDINPSPLELRISPLQAAIASAALINHGVEPTPRIALAIETFQQGWVVLPPLGKADEVIPAPAAREAALALIQPGRVYWSHLAQSGDGSTEVTWLIAGTLPDWQGAPLILVMALEEHDELLAASIRDALLGREIIP